MRDGFGNPSVTKTPIVNPNAGLPSSASTVIAANPSGDPWRYQWHNGTWWYWTTENRWVYRNGNAWMNYEPAVAIAREPAYTGQPAFGNYSPNPYGYYSSPYGYSTGYGGYYNYGPGYRGGYYGPGGYYGQPGISIGTGRGFGLRLGF
jgi:hypothetical protein